MSNLPPPPPPPPPGRGHGRADGQHRRGEPRPPSRAQSRRPAVDRHGQGSGSWPQWTIWVLVGVLAAAFLVPSLWPSDAGVARRTPSGATQVEEGQIATAVINTGSGKITGEFTNGDTYSTTGGGDAACPTPTSS